MVDFYRNHGRRCAQTVVKSIATGDRISYETLDNIMGRSGDQVTTPVQIAYGLLRLGIDFYYPVKQYFLRNDINLERASEEAFGAEITSKLNLIFIKEARNELKNEGGYELIQKFSLEDLKKFMPERTAVVLINYDLFVNREDRKSGHYLIIRGIERDIVRVMDCGPVGASPNKIISKRRLESSLMETPLDYGVLLV